MPSCQPATRATRAGMLLIMGHRECDEAAKKGTIGPGRKTPLPAYGRVARCLQGKSGSGAGLSHTTFGAPGSSWSGGYAAASIIREAFSPIMIDGALVLPDVSVGMMEASATRRPPIPWTRSWSSTTAIGSWPILQVPTGW